MKSCISWDHAVCRGFICHAGSPRDFFFAIALDARSTRGKRKRRCSIRPIGRVRSNDRHSDHDRLSLRGHLYFARSRGCDDIFPRPCRNISILPFLLPLLFLPFSLSLSVFSPFFSPLSLEFPRRSRRKPRVTIIQTPGYFSSPLFLFPASYLSLLIFIFFSSG